MSRRALAGVLKQARPNKAFENSPRLGLALEGTGAGRTHKRPCRLCHPLHDQQGQLRGSRHKLVLVSVVGAGVSLPADVEPYVPGDGECAAGKRLLRRVLGQVGRRFAKPS